MNSPPASPKGASYPSNTSIPDDDKKKFDIVKAVSQATLTPKFGGIIYYDNSHLPKLTITNQLLK